jgi:CRP-like cAMP-binding protein
MKNCIRYPHLMKAEILADLPEDVKAEFLDQCSVRIFDKPTEVLQQGVIATGMFMVAHGSIDITHDTEEGQTVIIHTAGQGEIVGEVEAIADKPCAATVTVAGNSTLLFCPKPILFDYLKNTVFLRNLVAIFYERLVRDNTFKSVDQFYPVERRLCAYLQKMSREKPQISKSQAYIANVVGCSRQTVNRELGILRDQKVIALEKGSILILDREALDARVGAFSLPADTGRMN